MRVRVRARVRVRWGTWVSEVSPSSQVEAEEEKPPLVVSLSSPTWSVVR